jgi:fructokinase
MGDAHSKPVAIGLGEVLWDLFPSGKQLGGAPANFAYHAQQLGAASSVVSAVGRDGPGEEILRRLSDLRLDASHITVDTAHPTGTVTVELDAAGVPSYVIHEDVAWDFLPVTPAVLKLAGRADVVGFGSLAQRSPATRRSIRRILASTGPNCLRLFDINLRQHYYGEEVVRESLALTSALKLNDQEVPVVAKLLGLSTDEGEAVGALLQRFQHLNVVAVTRGERGSSLYTLDAADHHGGYAAETVDTVGAGDAFTAALATGLLRREPLHRINDAANRVASYVCTQHGATPALPRELVEGLWR